MIDNQRLQDIFITQTSSAVEMMQRKEEELLIKVLSNYLGREPKEEDFKRVTRYFYHDAIYKYQLSYDNILLGEVKNLVPNDPWGHFDFGIGIEFIPNSASSE